MDGQGNLFIADQSAAVVREVNALTGVITTVAGNGTAGNTGDHGQATSAELGFIDDVAVDGQGNLFIADSYNNVIREVNLSTGVITTVAGNSTQGSSGDNGQATSAELNNPQGVVADSHGNLFIADTGNDEIRAVNLTSGVITDVAGGGTSGLGDGGQATSAELNNPVGIALDGSGNLYIADLSYHRVRKVNLSTGVITTVAGTGTSGSAGDGGPATAATMALPIAVAVDSQGNLFVADEQNLVVREVFASSGIIATYAGTGVMGKAPPAPSRR